MDQPVNGKPLPEITDLTRPFWQGAHEGRLMMQKCAGCGALNFMPKPWCVECGDRGLEWVQVRPTGTIYSHTVASVVMMNFPAWKGELPVILCIVELDDGPRMYAQLTGCAPAEVRIGARVEAHFSDISADAGIPRFRPV